MKRSEGKTMTVTTVSGDVFNISWIGVASIDGVLRFAVKNSNVQEIIRAFTDAQNCETLISKFDETETMYVGYTVFRGIQINYDNETIVSLSRI